MKFKVGQQVRTTKEQEYDNGINDRGSLPVGSIGTIIVVVEEYESCYVEFGNDHDSDVWAVLENELEAMGSE